MATRSLYLFPQRHASGAGTSVAQSGFKLCLILVVKRGNTAESYIINVSAISWSISFDLQMT